MLERPVETSFDVVLVEVFATSVDVTSLLVEGELLETVDKMLLTNTVGGDLTPSLVAFCVVGKDVVVPATFDNVILFNQILPTIIAFVFQC